MTGLDAELGDDRSFVEHGIDPSRHSSRGPARLTSCRRSLSAETISDRRWSGPAEASRDAGRDQVVGFEAFH
jgi:hypothetical protein